MERAVAQARADLAETRAALVIARATVARLEKERDAAARAVLAALLADATDDALHQSVPAD